MTFPSPVLSVAEDVNDLAARFPRAVVDTWHAAAKTIEFVPPDTMSPGTLRKLKSRGRQHSTAEMTKRERVAEPETETPTAA